MGYLIALALFGGLFALGHWTEHSTKTTPRDPGDEAREAMARVDKLLTDDWNHQFHGRRKATKKRRTR